MSDALPAHAAWRHRDARDGFEVVFLRRLAHGYRFEGHTTALEQDAAWAVGYQIDVDREWITRSASVVACSTSGRRQLTLRADRSGGWLVCGEPAPELRGCLDVDLEASAFTNALPVRRLRLSVGQAADAPTVYVRALDLAVERLEQRYVRIADHGSCERYDYAAPRFGYTGRLAYDATGLLTRYPGLAERIA